MKKYTAILMMVVMIGLTGCASSSVTLTDTENAMVAEYIAGLMLKYDRNYEGELLYATPITSLQPETSTDPTLNPEATEPQDAVNAGEATLEPSATSEPLASTVPEEENVVDIASLYSENIEVTYLGYDRYDSYPNKTKVEEFTIEPQKGSKLLVVELEIKNKTDKKQKIQLSKNALTYQLIINNEVTYHAEITPLLNDIQYLDISLEANKTKKAVVIFGIDEKLELNQLNLNIASKHGKAVIKIK